LERASVGEVPKRSAKLQRTPRELTGSRRRSLARAAQGPARAARGLAMQGLTGAPQALAAQGVAGPAREPGAQGGAGAAREPGAQDRAGAAREQAALSLAGIAAGRCGTGRSSGRNWKLIRPPTIYQALAEEKKKNRRRVGEPAKSRKIGRGGGGARCGRVGSWLARVLNIIQYLGYPIALYIY